MDCDSLYTEPIDLSVIKDVPMTIYMAEVDQFCKYASEKEKYQEMGTIPKLKVLEGTDHLFPSTMPPNVV